MENPDRNKKCPACSKKYVCLNAFKKHICKKHPNCTEATIILSQDVFTTPGSHLKPIICRHCSTSFPSLEALKQHKIASHGWKCRKCPTLPPFEDGSAWQVHFNRVHAADAQSGTVKKTEKKTAPPEVDEHARKLPPPPSSTSPHSRLLATGSEKSSPEGDHTKSPPGTLANEASDKMAPDAMDINQETTSQSRFYCQEEDCGRGFSTKGFLDTHTKFFHPKKPGNQSSDTVKRETPRSDPPNDTTGKNEEVNRPVLQTPDRNTTTSRSGEGEKDISAYVATQFRCRICEKLPSAATQPTATSCGHLFCYECITLAVTSASECPICYTSILPDRITRLNIPC